MVLTKLMALMKLMGLEKLIDGSDEICLMDLTNFKRIVKNMDPKLLWYTIAHPSLAWEEEFFLLEKKLLFIMM